MNKQQLDAGWTSEWLTSTQKTWLLSLCAHLCQQNGMNQYQTMALVEPENEKRCTSLRLMLERDYEVTSANELRDRINWLHSTQASKDFFAINQQFLLADKRDYMAVIDAESDTVWRNRKRLIEPHCWSLRDCGVKGFDIARIVFLVRSAYTVGMVSLEDAWRYLIDAGRVAQNLFASAEQFATSHLVGRLYWNKADLLPSPELDGAMETAFEHLNAILSDPSHPWCQLSWHCGL
ncbi:DUF1266 domain-containing protein [Corallincola spongiicola]|uniref:DUF1266 domain-containing protein n=1 Tax=Corallincola spongiicola TaxID=2520508 RepID=A0ABY1WT58_9GAMM|nr:DUF1266 domain-containing protein [Corallincola spongiicola]TAA47925.1 DUF1266 domain-containing protein [Corallincola spongiicola]